MSQVELIPVFDDNYVFLITNGKNALLVDPGDAHSPLKIIEERGLQLDAVLVTHHHHDHIDGLIDITNVFPDIPIYAPQKNKSQIVLGTKFLSEGDKINWGDITFQVMEMPGHTLGHIAYYNEKNNWMFSGDVLFGLGCGRLFEGSAEQAFDTLARFKKLPPETLVYCTHEYTENNLKFCKSVNIDTPELQKYEIELLKNRKGNDPSVPLILGSEFSANPFLIASSVQEFASLRKQRNTFKA
ncbi:hydroxyacylglutathione hydrolase [bacterium]|nr:hydroxyacylglutathione hydrolase [bacterium]